MRNQNQRIQLFPIKSPTVSKGQERVRILLIRTIASGNSGVIDTVHTVRHGNRGGPITIKYRLLYINQS
jgi:hypothetical protein